ncbi:MAG: carboxypeptidase regulatory-like domain-containing protein [Bacteroidetes bacterium]|nr:carboxypeptidase regulatory-like domain-containing protein [Bacteroidota bacterium]
MKTLFTTSVKQVTAVCVTVLLAAFIAFPGATGTGKLTGKITYETTGATIPYANVTLYKGTSVIAGTTSDAGGFFILEAGEGVYDLVVISPGFELFRKRNVRIEAVKTSEVNVVLKALKTGTTDDKEADEPAAEAEEYSVISTVSISSSSGRETCKRSKAKGERIAAGCVGSMSRSEESYRVMLMDYSADADFSMPEGYITESTDRAATGSSMPGVGPGVLTAGEVNDFSKWEMWKDITDNQLKEWQEYWKFKPEKRYTVQITTDNGTPVIDAVVTLRIKSGRAVWTTRTDNTGKAELWADIFPGGEDAGKSLTVETVYDGKNYGMESVSRFHDGINTLKTDAKCNIPDILDAMFVVDATGSMGDEIAYLKEELNDVISKVQQKHSELNINLGSVFYRDKGDAYLTVKSEMSSDISKTINFIRTQYADGGGDTPEAVDEALKVAVREMKWSENARARLLFLVLDAPPHYTDSIINSLQELTREAASKGIRIIPVTGSGIDKATEYLMRAMALATNGTYVFLTDHSGVGNPHIEPTTDKYDVEKLNDLLLRLFFQYTQAPECEIPFKVEEEDINDTMIVTNRDTSLFAQDTTGNALPDSVIAHISDTVNAEPQDSIKTDVNPNDFNPEDLIRWKYYPNPTSGKLIVEVESNIGELFLTDLSGKILRRYELHDQNKLMMDIGDFPSGIYFLRYFISDDKFLDGKVILVHSWQ